MWEKSIFPISRKVPVPSDMSLNRKFYPWTSLGIGDSFFVRGGKVTAMSAKAAWAGRQYGKQYVCRTVRGGVRVWCVGDRDPQSPRKRNKRVDAQGIVTETDETRSGSVERSEIEPGPKDAPEISGIPVTTVKGETL